ncbi:enoyl-ACP reductase [candidate division KSB1 bacterium]|nr:MAG: enoyl-ACP reductase [candidate division KSB1 bacterium]
MEFTGKIALITGGTRGIGRETGRKLGQKGAELILNYWKNDEAAEKTKTEFEKNRIKVSLIKADIGKPEQIKQMFKKIEKVDIFISNAVYGVVGPAVKIGKFGWSLSMDVNARAYLLCAQESVKRMKDNSGKIVAVSSLGSYKYIPGYTAVGASKAAIEAITRYLAVELAEKGINVNTVSAGPVETDSLKYFKNINDLKKEWINKTPFKRIAKPEEIADVIVFLCSERAKWIQGQTIIVDGGMSIC